MGVEAEEGCAEREREEREREKRERERDRESRRRKRKRKTRGERKEGDAGSTCVMLKTTSGLGGVTSAAASARAPRRRNTLRAITSKVLELSGGGGGEEERERERERRGM